MNHMIIINQQINDIISKLRDMNILVLSCGNNGQYIRILPSFNITEEEIDILDNLRSITFMLLMHTGSSWTPNQCST